MIDVLMILLVLPLRQAGTVQSSLPLHLGCDCVGQHHIGTRHQAQVQVCLVGDARTPLELLDDGPADAILIRRQLGVEKRPALKGVLPEHPAAEAVDGAHLQVVEGGEQVASASRQRLARQPELGDLGPYVTLCHGGPG